MPPPTEDEKQLAALNKIKGSLDLCVHTAEEATREIEGSNASLLQLADLMKSFRGTEFTVGRALHLIAVLKQVVEELGSSSSNQNTLVVITGITQACAELVKEKIEQSEGSN
ncbi:hypothetical protein FQN53_006003 [Emmonsiellopsis sp. PD_33]|nr:hypothetical protein FQN53_006003 [Emmonsiellopsis sp. PD_33]KAK2798819.1 hypothetical protein FQN51_007495 [Onygenales sp. PD_10]